MIAINSELRYWTTRVPPLPTKLTKPVKSDGLKTEKKDNNVRKSNVNTEVPEQLRLTVAPRWLNQNLKKNNTIFYYTNGVTNKIKSNICISRHACVSKVSLIIYKRNFHIVLVDRWYDASEVNRNIDSSQPKILSALATLKWRWPENYSPKWCLEIVLRVWCLVLAALSPVCQEVRLWQPVINRLSKNSLHRFVFFISFSVKRLLRHPVYLLRSFCLPKRTQYY